MNTTTRAPVRAARKDGALTRWVIPIFVVGLLLLGGYKGAHWLQANRDMVLRKPPFAPAGANAQPAAAAGELADAQPAQPDASSLAASDDPPAPAVLGGAGIHLCRINGQNTYTSRPCPEGAALPNATGLAPRAPAEDMRTAAADAGQAARDAECGYLAAENARLGYEFSQPLPPPVLDQIASRVKTLRERSAQLKCEPAAAPARARTRQPAAPPV